MGLISLVLSTLFGGGRNALRETVEVFRENADAGAERQHDIQKSALDAFTREFDRSRKGAFDRMMDGVNRLPRPLLAFGCFVLIGAAMIDPVWFSSRMMGLALVPEPLWWLLGVIVSFYFGARHQAKGQAFQQSIAQTLTRTGSVVANIRALQELDDSQSAAPVSGATSHPNNALDDWRVAQSKSPETATM